MTVLMNHELTPLPVSFYERDAVQVAQELLGKLPVRQGPGGRTVEMNCTASSATRSSTDYRTAFRRKGRGVPPLVMFYLVPAARPAEGLRPLELLERMAAPRLSV